MRRNFSLLLGMTLLTLPVSGMAQDVGVGENSPPAYLQQQPRAPLQQPGVAQPVYQPQMMQPGGEQPFLQPQPYQLPPPPQGVTSDPHATQPQVAPPPAPGVQTYTRPSYAQPAAPQSQTVPAIPVTEGEQPPAPDSVAGTKDVAAVLVAIDKVYAKKEELTVPVGSVQHSGELDILVKRCLTRVGEAMPRYAALLEINDRSNPAGPERVFSGWMFSDSPSLSALEHPHYDVTVVRCEAIKPEKEAEKPAAKADAKAPAKDGKKPAATSSPVAPSKPKS